MTFLTLLLAQSLVIIEANFSRRILSLIVATKVANRITEEAIWILPKQLTSSKNDYYQANVFALWYDMLGYVE